MDKKPKYLVTSRFKNTALLCMLMLMIGYSSYALIVIRSVANPPMDQNSPEDIFTPALTSAVTSTVTARCSTVRLTPRR